MQEALGVYKAGGLNKEPEYTKIFVKKRKVMPYFGMTLGIWRVR